MSSPRRDMVAGSFWLPRRIAVIESMGFGAVVAVIWMDEIFDLPHRFFGAPVSPTRLAEAGLESGLVLLLCAAVLAMTLRVARRVAYLESYVVLCAWCRRVRLSGEWLSFEMFLAKHRADTSHGMCPDCGAKYGL